MKISSAVVALFGFSLMGCSEATAPKAPNISGSYTLFSYFSGSLPGRWLPDHRRPDPNLLSASESTIESGSITFTRTATANVYSFSKVETIPNFRVSPISRVHMVFTSTGTATINETGHVAYAVEAGPDAGQTMPGAADETGASYRGYNYRK